MADSLWGKRYRVAAAALLGSSAILGLLDAFARSAVHQHAGGGHIAVIAVSIILALSAVATMGWKQPSHHLFRLLPAGLTLAGLLVAITAGNITASPYAPVGLTLLTSMVLGYIGFVTSPGLAVTASPAVLIVLLIAYQREPNQLSLALPLVAVPTAALIAEVISALGDRANRSSAQGANRLERLGRLEDVLRRFRQPGSVEQAALQVASAAREIFEVERCTVVLRNTSGELIPVNEGPVVEGELGTVASRALVKAVTGEHPEFIPTGTNGTMLVLPLPAAEAPAGAVLVYPIGTDDPEFTLELARLFAVQIAIAIEHLFIIDELNRANVTDSLTGLGNRRHADALLESLQPGDALILLDLDGFKHVNDTHGHDAGDEVLRNLSAHLQAYLRDSDMSARLGGDEFLIVARRAHADPLAVATRVLQGWGSQGLGATLSAGVALQESGHTYETTFGRADKALYRAKAKGKNQAQLWSPESFAQDVTDIAS